MHKILNLKVDYKQEPKVEKLLDLLKIKYQKQTTFFLDRVFQITATTRQQQQLQQLLEIVF